MGLEDAVAPPPRAAGPREHESPPVIVVEDLHKSFEIPTQRVDSLKERALHPFSSGESRRHAALRGISFDVRRGEFFGIVGRNGTGKSTLLKVLASIYRADRGQILMAGRPAPFIELGVGFNPELTGRENVVLNGVMMGLPRRDAEERLEEVIAFAELEEFVDLKLKNYSSGMMVRLAFSVMLQSDAEILLIDEVLAVGDAAFQQKCIDVFHEMRDSERTVVLVTHDMSAVDQFCHRAMLLEGGRIEAIGEPQEVSRRYLQLNFDRRPASGEGDVPPEDERADVGVVEAWLERDGQRVGNLEIGEPAEFHAILEVRADVPGPSLGFTLTNGDGVEVTGFATFVGLTGTPEDHLAAGERVHVSAALDNRLAPGRYVFGCWVHRNHLYADLVLHAPHILDFVVYGTDFSGGAVSLFDSPRAEREAPR